MSEEQLEVLGGKILDAFTAFEDYARGAEALSGERCDANSLVHEMKSVARQLVRHMREYHPELYREENA